MKAFAFTVAVATAHSYQDPAVAKYFEYADYTDGGYMNDYSDYYLEGPKFLSLEEEEIEYNRVAAQYDELLALYNEALAAEGYTDQLILGKDGHGQAPLDYD